MIGNLLFTLPYVTYVSHSTSSMSTMQGLLHPAFIAKLASQSNTNKNVSLKGQFDSLLEVKYLNAQIVVNGRL